MPQVAPALWIGPVQSTALQQPITLQTGGNLVLAGNPGGPVVFGLFGSVSLTQLGANALRTGVQSNNPS